jgi:hypothetical protein
MAELPTMEEGQGDCSEEKEKSRNESRMQEPLEFEKPPQPQTAQ